MKKLITSAIAATALLFGFAGCSNDLHDVENTPYTNSAGAVYILGGISSSTMERSVKSTEATFDDTKSYKVTLDKDGKAKFTFTYSGNDGWSAGAGNTAFAIVADVSNGWNGANAARWGTGADGVAVGSEGSLVGPTMNNAKITGLSAGTQYTVELAITAAGGTMKVTQGLSGVPFELIAIDDKGNLTTATSITAKDAKTFTYEVTPTDKEQTLKYIARYGNSYFVPSASGSFTVDGSTKQDAAIGTAQPSSVANPLKVTIPTSEVAGKDHVSSYKLTFSLDNEIATATKLTASVEKVYVMPYENAGYINGGFSSKVGNVIVGEAINWDKTYTTFGSGKLDGKPYAGGKVYKGTYTIAQSNKNDNFSTGVAGIGFGVIKGASDWSVKYTGATLKDAGVEYELTSGATNNNIIGIQAGTQTSDIVLTFKYYIYENVYSNGSYSTVTKLMASYTGTGTKALEPAIPPKYFAGSANIPELTWNDNVATANVTLPANYEDGWNDDNKKTLSFGLLSYNGGWYKAYRDASIVLDGVAGTAKNTGSGNNRLTSSEDLAGKTIKMTFTYNTRDGSVEIKAETVK